MNTKALVRSSVAMICAFVLALTNAALPGTGSAAVPRATNAAPDSATLKARAINSVLTRDAREADIVVGTMEATAPAQGRAWRAFLNSWETLNQGLTMNTSPPSGLPRSGHVFVVLGAGLTKKGRLSAKLERRLKLTLSALKAYPTSDVLLSGGHPKKGNTEAGVMRAWLLNRGVNPRRILIEDRSGTTVQNAQFSMKMLRSKPRYRSYSLISDASHLRRASILFRAATIGQHGPTGPQWQIKQLANVAYLDSATVGREPLSPSSVRAMAGQVASVVGVSSHYRAVVANPPAAARLSSLSVKTPASGTLQAGERPNFRGFAVVAGYGSLSRDVTDAAAVDGYTTDSVGRRTATVRFTDRGASRTATFGYEVVRTTGQASVALSKSKVKPKATVRVTATITSKTGVAPTGRVALIVDGRTVGTTTLTDAAKGVVVFEYRVGSPAKHTITVSYLGSPTVTPAKAIAPLTVAR